MAESRKRGLILKNFIQDLLMACLSIGIKWCDDPEVQQPGRFLLPGI